MQLADDVRKAIRAGLFITAAAVVGSFSPVFVWLSFNPEVDIHTVYMFSVLLPLGIAPILSFFQLRAKVQAERLAAAHYRLAFIDELTGLSNRRAFFQRAEALLQERAEDTGAPHGVFVCAIADIDDFKVVNDAYGHATGDEVLKAIAHTLRDLEPDNGLIARLGGEEFAMACILPGERAARVLCERLVRLVARRGYEHDGQRIGVTISLGFTRAHGNETISALLSRADRALYRAKQSGKNRAVEYSTLGEGRDVAALQAIAATMASAG